MRVVMELPSYSKTCGGIRDNVLLAESFSTKMMLRFQHISNGYPNVDTEWSVGLPDETFPECDVCITYSDTPYLDRLVGLPQVGKVYILMLSYGMNLPVERRNIHNKKVAVLCSSKKLEQLISNEGVKVHRLGLGLNMSPFSNINLDRKKYLAILFHDMLSKKYTTAVSVADSLYNDKVIDGVIVFGNSSSFDRFKKPQGLVAFYPNATPDQVNIVFNTCSCFLMPSISEGLNLTPIESALCGCPAVLCDGAIGETFIDKENCFIVPRENKQMMYSKCADVIRNFDTYSEKFMQKTQELTQDTSWSNVIKKLSDIICGI